ncbi:hypothetical protein OROGR_030307 [Orobanche gracilis]
METSMTEVKSSIGALAAGLEEIRSLLLAQSRAGEGTSAER